MDIIKTYKQFSIFYIILGFVILIFFSKCKYEYEIDFYKGIYAETTNKEPIVGLKVILLFPDGDTTSMKTDSTGFAFFTRNFYLNEQYFVEIKDIDGDENYGKFETITLELIELDTTYVTMK